MTASPITSRFDARTTALEVVHGIDLAGRTALVTGGAGGIGLEIVRALATAGARVIVADVDVAAGEANLRGLQESLPGSRIDLRAIDLASFTSIRAFAAATRTELRSLEVLINNAGVMACPLKRTVEGHEFQFGVNYLGHWLLANELRPALEAAGSARIVSVSSIGHRRADVDFDDVDWRLKPYDKWAAYGQSKTACSLLAVAWTARYASRGIVCNAMNPGGSMTGLQRHMDHDEMVKVGYIDADGKVNERWRSPAQCAATSAWLAADPALEGVSGRYFENCAEAGPPTPDRPMAGVLPYALDPERAERLWRLSEQLTAA